MKHKNGNEEVKKTEATYQETDNITGDKIATEAELPQNAEPQTSAEEELNDKVNQLNDKYLRLHAEFDNYRKRSLKERIDMIKTASEELIIDLLPVLDDFERALKSMENNDNVDALAEGVTLIYNKFRNILTSRGLQEIKTVGEDFNVDFQDAIAHIPAPEEELKDKVIEEVQKGYKLNEKVIRFAKVVVGS